MLGAVFGAAIIPASADAAFEKTIVDAVTGEDLGSITFPKANGSATEGVTFVLAGYTEEHLNSIMWKINASTGAIDSLMLVAINGDDPCPNADPQVSCSNTVLRVRETSFNLESNQCGAAPPDGIQLCSRGTSSAVGISFVDVTPAYSCEGFKGPLAKGPVAIKRKHLSWLRAALRDADGKRLRRKDLEAAPLLEITFEPAAEAAARLALPGIGADGTAFVPIGNQWHLLLTLKDLADPGSYTVKMVSGDPSAYRIAPTCEGVFVR
jgi:hypothetical protein